MNRFNRLIFTTFVLSTLALAGCSDGERAVAGPGKIASLDQRPSLSNPLKAAQGAGKRLARRGAVSPRSIRR
jgi:hypothetical protein